VKLPLLRLPTWLLSLRFLVWTIKAYSNEQNPEPLPKLLMASVGAELSTI